MRLPLTSDWTRCERCPLPDPRCTEVDSDSHQNHRSTAQLGRMSADRDEDELAQEEIPGVLVVRIWESMSFANTGQLKGRPRRVSHD
jgi:MFS superfamily sulfate permease-like transporter